MTRMCQKERASEESEKEKEGIRCWYILYDKTKKKINYRWQGLDYPFRPCPSPVIAEEALFEQP